MEALDKTLDAETSLQTRLPNSINGTSQKCIPRTSYTIILAATKVPVSGSHRHIWWVGGFYNFLY